jgi:drug/metabolite transporter (DMT)-like permease
VAHPLTIQPRRLIATTEGTHRGAFSPLDWGLLAGVALVWGSSFVFIEIALESINPGLITWGRIFLGFLTLSLFPAARRPVDRSGWPRLIVLSVTWTSFPFLLFPIAQQHIDSALAGMLNALSPIFGAAIAAVLLRRLPRRVQMLGLFAGFVGAILISLPALDAGGSNALGVAMVVAATASYGLSFNLAAPLQQEYGGPAVLWRLMAVATVTTFPFAIGGFGTAHWGLTPILTVGSLGILGTGLSYVAMTLLVGRVGPTRGGVAIFFLPVVAIVLGILIRDEHVLPIQLVGTAMILAGASVASRSEE